MKRNILIAEYISFIKLSIFSLILLSSFAKVYGQTNTWDGSSSNNWNTAANWSLNLVPTAAHDVVININAAILVNVNSTINKLTISNNAAVSFTSSGGGRTITIDNTGSSIASGSTLTLQGSAGSGTRSMTIAYTGAGQTMVIAGNLILTAVGEGTIYNATNSLTTVTGTITKSFTGGATIGVVSSTATNLSFLSGGTYVHGVNGNAIPTATWNVNSNCNITGITNTNVTGLNQTFGNFTWDCTGQGTNNVISTAGDIVVNGDFTLTSGIFALSSSTTAQRTLTIAGNYIQTGGTFDFNSVTNGLLSTINIAGNFTNSASVGSITTNGGGAVNGNIVFSGSSQQTLTLTNDNAPHWTSFIVNAGSDLRLGSNVSLTGDGSDPKFYADFIVNGTIDLGNYIIGETGSTNASHFALNNGAELITANANGISSSGLTGSVQVTGTRTYSAGADYIYNGSTAQNTGNGLPSIVNNLIFDNSSGTITFNSAITITNNFSINSGSVANLGTYTHSASDLKLGGAGTASGSWGSTSSGATNKNDTYFAATTGIINVTINTCALISAPATTGALICVGSTGTILSASGATSGQVYKWYSASSGGTLLKTSTNNADNTYTTPVLSVTTNYWVAIQNVSLGCESDRTQVTATFPVVSADDRNRAGTDSWIGHVFKRLDSSSGPPSDANAFTNYYGTITETESFNESFVAANSCLSLTATESSRSVYTEFFAARFRMNSTKTGVYLADIGSDDGARLTVDGTLIYNQWVQRGYTVDTKILFELIGTSNILCEYYESTGGNRVSFQNLVKVPNNLTSGTNQTFCLPTTASQISANNALTDAPISGTSGFTVMYQWQQATNTSGPWSDISGETSQNYTPSGFTAGTYYFRRKLTVSKTNPGTITVNASDFSGFATVTINDKPSITAILAPAALCAGGSLNPSAPLVTANGSTVTAQDWQIETTVGGGVFNNLTVPYTVAFADNGKKIRYNASNSCGTTNSNEVIITINDKPSISSISLPAAICEGETVNPTTPTIINNGSTVTAQGWQLETTVGGGIFVNQTIPFNPAFADNGKKLRYYATNTCGSSNSNEVLLSVTALPVITTQPLPLNLCEGESGNFSIETSATSPFYQWQYSNSSTGPWTITDGLAGVSGHTSNQLLLINVPLSHNNFYVSCVVTSNSCSSQSDAVLLKVNSLPATGEIIPD